VLLVAPDGTRTENSSLAGVHGCNNEAELHALCAALELAYAAGARRLLLNGDSDVALRYVRGPDATRIERLQVLVTRARLLVARFEKVQLLWLPRHRNRDADRLSRLALGLPEAARESRGGRRGRR
jgi:ribonuclease HI